MARIIKSQFPPKFDVTINGFDFEFVLEDSSGMHGETQSYYPTDDNLSADITFSTRDVIERDGRMEEFNFNDGDVIVADFTVDESDSAYGIHDWEQSAEQYFANADDMISAFKNWVSSVANKSAKKSQSKPVSFSDMVNNQRAKNKNTNIAKFNRGEILGIFEPYLDANSSQNDFEILLDKIRRGTTQEVIDQCNSIKGLMDMIIKYVRGA